MCEKVTYKNYVDVLRYGSEVVFALPFGVVGDMLSSKTQHNDVNLITTHISRYGRRTVFLIAATLSLIADGLIFIDSIWVLYVAQIIKGMACENLIYSAYIICKL